MHCLQKVSAAIAPLKQHDQRRATSGNYWSQQRVEAAGIEIGRALQYFTGTKGVEYADIFRDVFRRGGAVDALRQLIRGIVATVPKPVDYWSVSCPRYCDALVTHFRLNSLV